MSESKFTVSTTKIVASSAVMAALIAVLTAFSIKVTTLTVFNGGLLGVYIVAILFGFRVGLLATAVGSAIAELYLMAVRGDPAIFLLGLIAARLPCAAIVATFRERQPILGMVLGAVVQTTVFLVIDIPLFGLGITLPLVSSLPFNILLAVPAYLVIRGARGKLKTKFIL